MYLGDFIHLAAMAIPIVAIAGAFLVAALRIYSQMRVRELEIRQRIAMIEKGLVPPPEVDPARFEDALRTGGRFDRGSRAGRYRSAGITLIGIGVGLMVLIGVAGDAPNQGLGVGGFIAVLGLAFFLNSWLDRPSAGAPNPPAPGGLSSPHQPGDGPVDSSLPRS
ncbi:MAG TPA: DUF6249 domain-containing protein [Vicinamibacterales bacterium]|nr:DUF6249 domain-containing protein [Vicinamibacterales bacterium]